MKFSVAEITVAMKKAKINEYTQCLNTFKINGGISNKVANFPTIKLPAQNNVERVNNK